MQITFLPREAAMHASAVLGRVILSVRPSVRLSISRHTVQDDVPFYLKLALKVTQPLCETPTSINICL